MAIVPLTGRLSPFRLERARLNRRGDRGIDRGALPLEVFVCEIVKISPTPK